MGARVLILILALAACEKQSKLYCEKHSGDLDNCGYLDAGIDARPVCASDMDCAGSPGAPYCELNLHECVECYQSGHCSANPVEKFCDLSTFLCTSCVRNTDCTSNVCLPNGQCGDDGNVAYVDPAMGADNADCKMATPCMTVDAALTTKKPYIHLTGMINEAVVIDAQSVTILADPGTVLTRSMNGVILAITASSDVAIYDLTIVGAAEKGIALDMNSTLRLNRVTITGCNGKDHRAIESKNATLFVSRSTIASNAGGGILVDAGSIYQITNSFIYRNGATDTATGGLTLAPTSSAFNRFEMNTVVDNVAKATAPGGVSCAASIAAPNNLVVHNASGTILLDTTQIQVGGCNFSDSHYGADLTEYMFKVPDGTGPWDYHINAGSMAIDRGVASDIKLDVDGETRPQGAMNDLGADEFK